MSFVCDERFKDITYQLYYLFRSFFFFKLTSFALLISLSFSSRLICGAFNILSDSKLLSLTFFPFIFASSVGWNK